MNKQLPEMQSILAGQSLQMFFSGRRDKMSFVFPLAFLNTAGFGEWGAAVR